MKGKHGKVKFHPKGKEVSVPSETRLLDAAMEIGLKVRHVCGGQATCGTCRVMVEEGQEFLSPPTPRECHLLGDERIQSCFRLSCQARILEGDVVVRVPLNPWDEQKLPPL